MKPSLSRVCLAATVFAFLLGLPADARTWTSADGTKTFEGDLHAYDPATGVVIVMMANGKQARFVQDKLSIADMAFLKEQGSVPPPIAGPGGAAGGRGLFVDVPDKLPDSDGREADMSRPVQVFILMGQWNMIGDGKVEWLENAVKKDGKYPYLVDEKGNWTVRKDVRNVFVMRNAIQHNDWMSPTNRNAIGADIGIGHVLGHAIGAPVLILKSCQHHSSLAYDLLPPGVQAYDFHGFLQPGYGEKRETAGKGPTKPSGHSYAGWVYDTDVAGVKSVLENLQTYYPGAKGYEVAGFFWWHGDRDRFQQDYSDFYERNLAHLIKALRKEFGVPNAPFVCATLEQTPKDAPANKTKQIFDAQMAVDGKSGNYPEFKGNVATVYSHALRDSRMLGPESYNSKTIMNVGEAMGRAMVELLRNR